MHHRLPLAPLAPVAVQAAPRRYLAQQRRARAREPPRCSLTMLAPQEPARSQTRAVAAAPRRAPGRRPQGRCWRRRTGSKRPGSPRCRLEVLSFALIQHVAVIDLKRHAVRSILPPARPLPYEQFVHLTRMVSACFAPARGRYRHVPPLISANARHSCCSVLRSQHPRAAIAAVPRANTPSADAPRRSSDIPRRTAVQRSLRVPAQWQLCGEARAVLGRGLHRQRAAMRPNDLRTDVQSQAQSLPIP